MTVGVVEGVSPCGADGSALHAASEKDAAAMRAE
jgi:hypothetical protein